MDTQRAALALARASEALVLDHDTAGFLANVLNSCQEVLTSDTSGILSAPTGQPLQLLAASSHTSAELELHQSQIDEGPCVDARNDNAAVSASGDDEIRARWPVWGEAMIDAGFHAIHSSPLRWHDRTLGAMGLFRISPEPFTPYENAIAQAFADTVALLIVHGDPVDLDRIDHRIEVALSTRIVVEQAKGVLAQQRHVAMDEAYVSLVRLAASEGRTLTDIAHEVITQAAGRTSES